MKVQELMTADVATIEAGAPLVEAARRMRGLDVGPLPVAEGERLIGMLTDRDITIRATAEGKNPSTTTVREVMTTDLVYCSEDDSIEDALRAMQEHQLRRLLVVDSSNRIVGIVSLGDVARHTQDKGVVGQTLERISEPAQD